MKQELAFSISSLAAIALVFLIVFAFFIRVAWTTRGKSWTLGGFFLGGRNIGASITEHSTWGTSFSFANGIFYFAVLGFYGGLSAIWFQIPWTISLFALGLLVPKIIFVTQKHTIHGFIGEMFGSKSRVIASVVTTFGFLGAYSFEIYVSVQIICAFLHLPDLTIPLSIIFSLFCAAYCEIGGFGAAAKTDKYQNMMGLVAVIFLVYLVFRLTDNGITPNALSFESMKDSFFDFSGFPTIQIIGIMCFASFTNLVDMSNWQNVAANGELPNSEHRKVTFSIFKAAIWSFFFPAVFGVFFGYIFKGTVGMTENVILPNILTWVFPNSGFAGGLFIGVILISLLATALSTADSYLLSSAQTVTWDILEHKNIKNYENPAEIKLEEQRSIIHKARRYLYVLAIASIFVFAFLAQWKPNDVFAFQFVIFGSILALVPTTLCGLALKFKKLKPSKGLQNFGFTSLLVGFSSGLLTFGYYLYDKSINIYAWSPIVTLFSSLIIFVIGFILHRKQFTHEN